MPWNSLFWGPQARFSKLASGRRTVEKGSINNNPDERKKMPKSGWASTMPNGHNRKFSTKEPGDSVNIT